MKKVLSVIMLFAGITASAQDFTYTYPREGQTLKYLILDAKAKTCEVSRNDNVSGDVQIPGIVISGKDTLKVTRIGEKAFDGCIGLTSVEISDSVKAIGERAFNGCSGLTSVKIPDSVKTIGYWAFSGCSSLTSIKIPESVTNIGGWAFDSCSSLTKVYIHDIKAWCNIQFGVSPFFRRTQSICGRERD